jgi:hypothetical protein
MTKQLNSVSNLLEHTNLIRKKYDEFAEYTGENFNVFSILGLYSHELSHSTFIGNLLNAKGKHGQKDVFLKLFIEEVKELFQDKSQLENFETSKSFVITEKYTGNGYIDIFITNGRNSIIIENKVWADDQHQQLVRYNEFEKNAPIIYLTLDGKEPDNLSKGNLKVTEDFIRVSYKEHIVNWLEKCIKEMANKPIIRETLNQYLNLVKQLTNQTTNNKMGQEVIDIILKNVGASKLVFENYEKAIKQSSLQQVKKLKEILEKRNLECSIERASRGGGDGLFILCKTFEIESEYFDLGINIELANDHFFFCVVKQAENRNDKINTQPKFTSIKEYLHQRIPNLTQVTNWTIGKANDFIVGIDRETYYLPTTDNTIAFEEVANKIAELKAKLNS